MAAAVPDWYKDAIIYAVDVANFADGNGDGVGDFPGLTQRLDYLADLGVTCLWLLPFFPTPNRDNGYDVSDYVAIDPRHGTLADFARFRQAAADRGVRLILDLVVHHTSDQHPWFQAAHRDPASRYRPYYVWTNEPPAEAAATQIFPGVEEGVWTYDDLAGAYYLHQFYDFEPDLNVEHGLVQDEVRRIVAFWCDQGADGLRVDAASHMLGRQALLPQPTTQPHQFLRQLRSFLDDHRDGGILIAEADVERDELGAYFADGMHLLYNFLFNNYLFLAFARGEAEPLIRGLRLLPEKPAPSQWATFLRNLDELDLERLTDDERADVFRAFAPEETMRSYGRGIRRRLAPMLGGDQRRVELAFSLLLTLPGTPVLSYGDEIGLGDDLSQPERESVRVAMQWANAPNGGFSDAPPAALAIPVVKGGPFGYERVNVAAQRRDPDSLLNRVRRMIATRRACLGFGRGVCHGVETGDPAAFAHLLRYEAESVLAVHNLGDEARRVTLALDTGSGSIIDLITQCPAELGTTDPPTVDLPPYGYRWFQLGDGATPAPPPASGKSSA